ncbi:hypothetical protein A3H03_01925 [Candidatus Kuenenbacteria bacterium RIFCSPLOWO2_12_FULL_42_13]|uniref:Uncharacterized protein n=4 Tax=Candidatus Kueneniibacteriota TaxID=1752740 RepID=A0A1F6FZS1_9BACT|nr:MAG: hypothetical protein A3C68_01505 [Candidatus Kuenenbacteria bacterium RIFCSPHIGHO2_02_FULL_42_29]OGG91006.1 MAG: hypothetical protein A3H55_01180 [Candidatus Kuenenbacteria bacterium RIFCSPLOWO2_02_FULL_42_16]OGG91341.1 MAG: hypothetical protein A3H03_01925 [Candidatus Kuenenbacteria bacterium RIFCSPLOWO2_12_FULL_42_13]OGG95951.1 MAG: hypothetical protein A2V95_02610 [Candidatus Kuenenbacteria bacterium RBG_16_41_7]OGH01201.1 MAG: hypothetical protein A3E04_03580 [Candidatus Kuenenbacte
MAGLAVSLYFVAHERQEGQTQNSNFWQFRRRRNRNRPKIALLVGKQSKIRLKCLSDTFDKRRKMRYNDTIGYKIVAKKIKNYLR